MDSDQSFQELLLRVRNGEQDAATRLVRLYEGELRRFVRYRLNQPKMRRFLDSLDVCQSVFAKFFVRLADGDYDLQNREQLHRLLVRMTNNKLLDHFRKAGTARHGTGAATFDGAALESVADGTPDPRRRVEELELVSLVRGRLSTDELRVLDRWMAGDDWQTIGGLDGATADGARKRLTRAIDRAAEELGWRESS